MSIQEKALDVAKETTTGVLNKLLGPSAEVLGNTLAQYTEKKLSESNFWGPLKSEQRRQNINETFKIFVEEFNKLEPQQKKELSVNIVAPIIDSLLIYFEEENYKTMFAKLLASSFDKSKSQNIHPSFVEIIKELNTLDAKILVMVSESNYLPYAKPFIEHHDNSLTPLFPDLFLKIDSNYNEFQHISSIQNLERLKLITLRNDIICFDNEYDCLKQTSIYKCFEKMTNQNDVLILKKYRVELTYLGKDFIKVCC